MPPRCRSPQGGGLGAGKSLSFVRAQVPLQHDSNLPALRVAATGAPVPFKEFDTLRKLAGNRQRDLVDSDRTASAAWGAVKRLLDESEQGAITAGKRLAPTGTGPFGPVFAGLSGDPKNAAAHLLHVGDGEVPAALTHADVPGPISMVYGAPPAEGVDGYGVAKLAAKHPEVLDDPQSFIASMHKNAATSGPNRIRLTDDELRRGVVRLTRDDQPGAPWLLTAYEKPSPALGGAQSATSARTDTAGLVRGGDTARSAGSTSLPDIDASFRDFDLALNPPPELRDPRLYTGELASVVSPEAAQALQQGRALHQDMVRRMETGPWSYVWRTGADGLPMAQGAEAARRFVNSGMSQLADIQALKAGVLDRGPTMQAAREYALSDLIEKSTNALGQLSADKLSRNLDSRSLMFKELLEPKQMQQLRAVLDDATRAAEASRRGIGPGSNTYQNAANALHVGLLDSSALGTLANRIPFIGGFTGPALDVLRTKARDSKAAQLAELLADPGAAANALEQIMQRRPMRNPLIPLSRVVPAALASDQ